MIMKEIEWDNYQKAWKNDQHFQDNKLSADDIQNFMHSNSKSLGAMFRKSVVMDVVLKGILWIATLVLLLLFVSQLRIVLVIVMLLFILSLGIIYQINVFRHIPETNNKLQSTRMHLQQLITFYTRKITKSILIGAISSSLVFIVGSMYYFYFKYGAIRKFDLDDFIVLGLGIVISFALSAWVQLKQNGSHISELESCLSTINEGTFDGDKLNRYKKNRRRNVIIISLILLLGLLLFTWLIAQS